jgi:2,6-dihydroxypseudooxynicotine hydrolase
VRLERLEQEARSRGISYRELVDRGEIIPRLITAGLHYTDTVETLKRITDDDSWCREWTRTALEHEERAKAAMERQRVMTAGMAFYRAAICYQFAQFLHFRDLRAKWAAGDKMVECYHAGMAFFVPPAEAVEIPFEGTSLPGYLRRPSKVEKSPCMIIISGTDSTKQEYHNLENQLLLRGVGTLSFDGPGQGEAWARVKWRPDWEKATQAVVDYLKQRPHIDAARIGVLGVSFGGHLAVRSAAADDRIRVCVCFGGLFDTTYYNWSQPIRHIRFRYLCGTDDVGVAKSVAEQFDLSGWMDRLRAPLLIVHGRLDDVVPPDQAERMYRAAPGPKELVIFEDGNHVCHNIPYKAHALVADWASEALETKGAATWAGLGPLS